MPRYTQEDLQALHQEVVNTVRLGDNRRIWTFIKALKCKEFRWNRLKRIKYSYFDDCRAFLRLPLSEMPKHLNDPKFGSVARWRLRLGK